MNPNTSATAVPLAELLRPRDLSEVIGQKHLLGPGKPLRIAFDSGKLHSMILWGPPGVGKTTLANLAAKAFNYEWIPLSAVFAGVKDIRAAMDLAKKHQAMQLQTILFIDEIHRFNKAQQDAFLPHIESGIFTFIGATTENPSFELNNALLSRARVYILKSLDLKAIRHIIDYALQNKPRGLGELALDFPDVLRDQVAQFADGDARTALNLVEIIADLASDGVVTEIVLQEALSASVRRFDKGGDEFYNQISALHKAVRGSAPDAALYWLVRMLDGGCDPLYVARRVVRMASEDIGNADPRALDIALHAWDVQERLGSPEGELTLAQAVIYMAVAPKSNAVYMAYNAARADVEKYGSLEVPLHIRNAPTNLMKELDYGKNYRYAHDEPDAYAAGENYFPDKMPQHQYYRPVNRGLEIKIAEKLAQLRERDAKITPEE